MKLKIAFKTPDAVEYALDQLFDGGDSEAETNDDGEQVVDGLTREEVEERLKQFISYGEAVSIEFDMEVGKKTTAQVISKGGIFEVS